MAGFFDPSQGFDQGNVNFADQGEALKRRRALLDAMMANSMQQPIVGSSGIGQALAKVGTMLAAAYGQRAMDQRSSELASARQADLGAQLQNYMTTKSGAPGQVLSDAQASDLMNFDMTPAGGLAEPVAADPRKAILQAMASQHPELQAIGKAELAKEPKPVEYQFINGQGGKVYAGNKQTGTLTERADNPKAQTTFSEPFLVDSPSGKIFVQRNNLTGQLEVVDKTPKVTATATANSAQKGSNAAAEALGKKVPEVLEGAQATVTKAQQGIESGQRMLQLASSPELISGFAAEPSLWLANLATKLGLTGPNAAAQTQAALSAMAGQTLDQVKRLPGAITEKERPFLEMAAAGKIDFTPENLRHLAGISIAANNNSLLEAVKQYSGTAGLEGAEVGASMYPLPRVSYSLDPKLFQEQGQTGRVQYMGTLPGFTQTAREAAAGAPAPAPAPAPAGSYKGWQLVK